MSLQTHLNNVSSRKIAKDYEAIKEAITELMKDHQSSDDVSSIRSFFTAPEIPYVEQQIWQEIVKTLQARFSTDYVRENDALIKSTLEDIVFDNTAPWIVDGAKPENSPSEVSKTTITDTSTIGSETGMLIRQDRDPDFLDRPLSIRHHRRSATTEDKSGVTWARSVGNGSGDCILTLDGGGVKSYSSILIINALMKEVIACENSFEREFTHYPRNFGASNFRPCHYFHKMYGTSTGGILAIALSRLRMTVEETIVTFESILDAMYAGPRNVVPFATRYSHSDLEAALASMNRKYCKQHEHGLCNQDHPFRWDWKYYQDPRDEGDSDDTESLETLRTRSSMDSKFHAFELRTPERQICQTICLTATSSGRGDEAYLLRTYNHQYHPDIAPPWVTLYNRGATDMPTWQIGRATTAAPFFFKPLELKGAKGEVGFTFKDGGIRENNPSYCAYSEAASFLGDDKELTILLSIGAGQSNSSATETAPSGIIPFGLSALSRYAKKRGVFKSALIKYTEGEDQHRLMRTIAKGEHRFYKRFEVPYGLEKIETDQWERGLFSSLNESEARPHAGGKTLSRIRIATNAYVDRQEVNSPRGHTEYAAPNQMLKQTAEKLVRMRRARELEAMTQGGEKREHWEAFMGKHLIGERDFFRKYQEEWDYALLGRKN